MIIICITAMVLIILSLWIIIGNLWIAFGGLFKKRKKFESLLPIVGGCAGVIGLWLLPLAQFHRFWWVPLVVDLGCVPLLISAIVDQLIKRLRSKN